MKYGRNHGTGRHSGLWEQRGDTKPCVVWEKKFLGGGSETSKWKIPENKESTNFSELQCNLILPNK